ncbi:hypothetical protein J4447_00935 [Candidatus Pacearchaeota archaeon]|nr:hypothetical protein [Candidatus Pacearchaeota archaeon]
MNSKYSGKLAVGMLTDKEPANNNNNIASESADAGEVASDALMDEALNIINGYEEGCAVKEICGMSDCGCGSSKSSKSSESSSSNSNQNPHSNSAPKLKE